MFAGRLTTTTRGGGEVERLIVVDAADAATARRETGLVEVDFAPATDADVRAWDDLTSRALGERDIEMLIGFVAKEQRLLGRRRARAAAEARGLVQRGIGGHVLSPEGLAMLAELDVPMKGRDPAPLLDYLIAQGTEVPERHDHEGRFRVRKLAELRGRLETLGLNAEEEADD